MVCSTPPASASNPEVSALPKEVAGEAEKTINVTRVMPPISPGVGPAATSRPAANAQAASSSNASGWLRPQRRPAKTARATKKAALSIRRPRCRYGSVPSEKATSSAPVAAIAPPAGLPTATPMASGSATPSALRNAITGASRAQSKCVMVVQKLEAKLLSLAHHRRTLVGKALRLCGAGAFACQPGSQLLRGGVTSRRPRGPRRDYGCRKRILHEHQRESERSLRRREPGQPEVPGVCPQGGAGRFAECRPPVSYRRRGGSGSCPGPLQSHGRSGIHQRQPEGGDHRRNLRVHHHVSPHACRSGVRRPPGKVHVRVRVESRGSARRVVQAGVRGRGTRQRPGRSGLLPVSGLRKYRIRHAAGYLPDLRHAQREIRGRGISCFLISPETAGSARSR